MTDEEIVQELRNEQSTSQESDGEDDPEIPRVLVTPRQASSHLEDLKYWILNQEVEDSCLFKSIQNIESFIHKTKLVNMKQTTIKEFLTVPVTK
jgi:hypothetical protein